MKPTLRQATPQDFATILRMLVKMHGEVGEFSLDVDKVAERIDLVLKTGVILLAETADECVGTMGLIGQEPWYSREKIVSDTWLFTTGPKRLSAFNTLVKAAHDYAEQFGLRFILSLHSSQDTSRKTKAFERHGRRIMETYQFTPAGGDFLTGKEAGNGML